MKQLIIAIDYDGTIDTAGYPNTGTIQQETKEIINKWSDMGHVIIINTCRTDSYEKEAVRHLDAMDIKYDYINENTEERIEEYGGDCRKISADIYIDDKSPLGVLLGTGDVFNIWDKIVQIASEGHSYRHKKFIDVVINTGLELIEKNISYGDSFFDSADIMTKIFSETEIDDNFTRGLIQRLIDKIYRFVHDKDAYDEDL